MHPEISNLPIYNFSYSVLEGRRLGAGLQKEVYEYPQNDVIYAVKIHKRFLLDPNEGLTDAEMDVLAILGVQSDEKYLDEIEESVLEEAKAYIAFSEEDHPFSQFIPRLEGLLRDPQTGKIVGLVVEHKGDNSQSIQQIVNRGERILGLSQIDTAINHLNPDTKLPIPDIEMLQPNDLHFSGEDLWIGECKVSRIEDRHKAIEYLRRQLASTKRT